VQISQFSGAKIALLVTSVQEVRKRCIWQCSLVTPLLQMKIKKNSDVHAVAWGQKSHLIEQHIGVYDVERDLSYLFKLC